jgi:hypothetical protein
LLVEEVQVVQVRLDLVVLAVVEMVELILKDLLQPILLVAAVAAEMVTVMVETVVLVSL